MTAPAAEEPSGLYSQIGSVGSLSYLSRYISFEPALGVQNGPYTLAFVPRLISGTTQFDLHVAPQLFMQAGIVYLQLGWVFELLDNTDDYQIIDFGPGAAFGARVELGTVSGGTLVLDAGFDVFFALYPDVGRPAASSLVPPVPADDFLEFVAEVSLPYSMLRIGLLYTFGP